MTSSFAFDIESCPLFDNIDAVWERAEFADAPMPDYASKYKTQETIDKYVAAWPGGLNGRVRQHEDAENARRQKLVDRSTLDAAFSKVLCIAYYCPGDDPYELQPGEGRGIGFVEWGPEHDLLERLWERCYIAQKKNGRIYTASGTQFDVRFCYRRSIVLGVTWPTCCRVITHRGARAYVHESFVDVSDVWAAGQ